MKHLFFALLVAATTFSSVYAGNHPSKEALDAVIKENRKEYAVKESALKSALQSPNTNLAKTTVADVLTQMQAGMRLTQKNIPNFSGDEQLKAIKHYNEMEAIVNKYRQLSSDVPANAKQLSDQAAAFAKTY